MGYACICLFNLFYTIPIIFFMLCPVIHIDIPTFTIDQTENKAKIGKTESQGKMKGIYL